MLNGQCWIKHELVRGILEWWYLNRLLGFAFCLVAANQCRSSVKCQNRCICSHSNWPYVSWQMPFFHFPGYVEYKSTKNVHSVQYQWWNVIGDSAVLLLCEWHRCFLMCCFAEVKLQKQLSWSSCRKHKCLKHTAWILIRARLDDSIWRILQLAFKSYCVLCKSFSNFYEWRALS